MLFFLKKMMKTYENSVKHLYFWVKCSKKNKKGEMLLSPFLPQIYHKLNLLMLWFNKYMRCIILETNNLDQMHQKSLKFKKC
jgi:hypothetical protein